MRTALLAVVSAGLLVACKPTLSKEERAQLDQLTQQATEQATRFDKERKDAVTAAQGKVEGRSDLGACELKFETTMLEPSKAGLPSMRSSMSKYLIEAALDRAGIWLGKPEELETKPGVTFNRFKSSSSYMPSEPSSLNRMKELADPKFFGNELVVILDKEIAPKITDDKTFEGGIAIGRAYAYSFADKAIVCACRFLAENSESVSVTMIDSTHVDPTSVAALEADLRAQSVLAAVKALSKAGPPNPNAHAADDAPAPSGSAKAGKAPPTKVPVEDGSPRARLPGEPPVPTAKKRKILE